jgi:Cohesin domain
MRQGRAVLFLALLSLTLFVLAGCGGGDETGGNSSQATSRLTLRLTTTNQALSNTRHTVLPIQAQQEPVSARLRVEVSAADLADPIVVDCTLPDPSPDELCQNVGETDEAILLEVGLQVPRGNDRRIVVTIFDASETQMLRGEDTVDLTASDVEVTINLSPIFEVTIGSPADPVASGTTFTVPVTINTGGTSLVSYLFELTFDPAIVVVTEIARGSTPFDDPVHDPTAFFSGSVRFAANNSTFTPASGLLNVANITFEVVAETAGTSDLILDFPSTPGGTGVLVTDSFAAIEDVTFVSGTVTTP